MHVYKIKWISFKPTSYLFMGSVIKLTVLLHILLLDTVSDHFIQACALQSTSKAMQMVLAINWELLRNYKLQKTVQNNLYVVTCQAV